VREVTEMRSFDQDDLPHQAVRVLDRRFERKDGVPLVGVQYLRLLLQEVSSFRWCFAAYTAQCRS